VKFQATIKEGCFIYQANKAKAYFTILVEVSIIFYILSHLCTPNVMLPFNAQKATKFNE
jgi:hypothetical protein